MFKNKKIFISLISIHEGGAGEFLSEAIKYYPNFIKIYPRSYFSHFFYLNRMFNKIQKILIYLAIQVIFKFKVKNIVLYHVQSIKYKFCVKLLKKAEEVEIWVLDASFFCKQSYNSYHGNVCRRCFDNFNPHEDCAHFPASFNNDQDYLEFINLLKKKDNLTFFCQNIEYKNMLIKKFKKPKVKIISLNSDNLRSFSINYNLKCHKDYLYDIAFHANFIPAKGSDYFLQFVEIKKDLKFFLPLSKNNVLEKKFVNMQTKIISWNEELISIYEKSKIIFCTSFWTHPSEFALLKSMLMSKVVAVLKLEDSFINNLPDNCVLKLDGILDNDLVKIEKVLSNPDLMLQIGKNAKSFAKSFILK